MRFYSRRLGAAGWCRHYAALSVEKQAALQARLQQMMRTNTYDAATGQITVTPITAAAFHELSDYYFDVFNKGTMPMRSNPTPSTTANCGDQMTAFFWWTAGPRARIVLAQMSPTRRTGRMRS